MLFRLLELLKGSRYCTAGMAHRTVREPRTVVEQKLGQIRSILTRDSSNQRLLGQYPLLIEGFKHVACPSLILCQLLQYASSLRNYQSLRLISWGSQAEACLR